MNDAGLVIACCSDVAGMVRGKAFPAEDFEPHRDMELLSDYRWGDHDVNHLFCKQCDEIRERFVERKNIGVGRFGEPAVHAVENRVGRFVSDDVIGQAGVHRRMR